MKIRARLKKAKAHADKLWQKLENAHVQGKRKRADHLLEQYLMSFDCRLHHLNEANCKLPRAHRFRQKDMLEIASEIDPYEPSAEPAIVHLIPKKENSSVCRPVVDFGVRSRTRQLLVAESLKARADLHQNQFATIGGVNGAIALVKKIIGEGNPWVAEIDIKDCYSSVNAKSLEHQLPLRKEVIRHTIIAKQYTYLANDLKQANRVGEHYNQDAHDGFLEEMTPSVWQGIPQGSAASPIVLDFVLAPMFHELPFSSQLVSYADNILVAGVSKGEVATMIKTLRSSLMEHPAGPLIPREAKVTHISKGFEFLGYEIVNNNGIQISPALKNLWKFEERYKDLYHSAFEPFISLIERHKRLRKLKNYVISWHKAFAQWDDVDDKLAEKIKKIDALYA